jgi:hypothetical protein
MRENGWVPVRAQEQSIRTEARRGFQKHVVRFARVEHLQTWEKNQVRPEVVLVNSHDKSSAYQLHCGLFRLVCTNGMVVSDGTFQRISIKHSGFNPESVIEASVDVTNALHVAPEELGGLLSSEVVSEAFVGARLVKAFNHLPAAQLGTNPPLEGQRQVVFVSSNDAEASATVAAVATQLGFAPIELGRLDKGGVPLHALGGEPGGLLFQNVEKLIGEDYE